MSGRTPVKQDSQASAGNATAEGGEATAEGEDGAAPVATPTPVPEPISITLSVVGDCTLGMDETFEYDTSFNNYYEMYGSAYFMQNVKDIFAADDLTIANLETTLTTAETKREGRYYNFKAPMEYAKILTDGNIEAVNTANNHMYDYLDQGYEDTLKALDAENIVHFGFDETAVMDVKGVKVGMLGVYEIDREFAEIETEVKEHIAKVKS
ncbi:MAG: CapA family protein, partial [Blautia sp.]|nr:CapA family protein [Blautia sp.]